MAESVQAAAQPSHTLRNITVGILLIAAVAGSVYGTLKGNEAFQAYVDGRVQARFAELSKNNVMVAKDAAVMTTVWSSPDSKEPVRRTMAIDVTKCQELKESNAQASATSTLSVDCLPVESLFGGASSVSTAAEAEASTVTN
jgi:hypothetical protein